MRKKISILINSLAAGGAERVVSLLLDELKNDFDIQLVLLSNTIQYDIPPEQKIICFDQSLHENGLIKLFKLPFLAMRYKKLCKKNNIETSLSFLKRANYINCLSRMYGLKSTIIISERTYLSNYLKFLGRTEGRLGKVLTKRLYPKADIVVPNSKLIQSDLEKNFNVHTKFTVINNPVSLKTIQQLSKQEVDSSLLETFTFISVGGLRREKNYELLIDAFSKLKDLNCNLLLIGKGEDEVKLRNKVKELALGSRIQFHGFDNNPYKFLSKAGCFVLSSDFEGFPNSIQEALACSLPVISTDCQSGPREILAPETNIENILKSDIEIVKYGILVPIKDPELMAKAMRLIYNDAELRRTLHARAFERASDFDVAGIVDQFKRILGLSRHSLRNNNANQTFINS
jgi:N-acetylgalactosamine-N,N'-diacetylbacillosaminyl-diphospho-undecaprenol 4-alpha-N-acetylgalactosaminyltransferase